VTAAEERSYESGRWLFWDNLVRDLRLAAHLLRKDLRFSGFAILGLGLGIGLNTASFTLMNTLVFRVEAKDPASFAGLFATWDGRATRAQFSHREYSYLRYHTTVFREVAAESARFHIVYRPPSNMGEGGEPRDAQASFVSPNFLAIRGFAPALGRTFTEEEERAAAGVVNDIRDQTDLRHRPRPTVYLASRQAQLV
jgi:hypothetical protein